MPNPRCPQCSKAVYPMEIAQVGEATFHKYCLRCNVCGCTLTSSTLSAVSSQPYCKRHAGEVQNASLLGAAFKAGADELRAKIEQQREAREAAYAEERAIQVEREREAAKLIAEQEARQERQRRYVETRARKHKERLERLEEREPEWMHEARIDRREKLADDQAADLAGSLPIERYILHVATDKPVYKPGDVLRGRATCIHATHNTPAFDNQIASSHVAVHVYKTGGSENARKHVAEVHCQVSLTAGVFAFEWVVPRTQAGGEYEIEAAGISASSAMIGCGVRRIDIRQHSGAPRMKSQLTFVRKGLGPGDRAVASFEAKRADGTVPLNAELVAVARIDGDEIYRSIEGELILSEAGSCSVSFMLPAVISSTDSSLTVTVLDDGDVSNVSRSIPIMLETVDVRVYPMGGEIVAGVPNTVFIACLTSTSDPADVVARLVSTSGELPASENLQTHVLDTSSSSPDVVASSNEFFDETGGLVIRTVHEGRGKFTFVPSVDRAYFLRIEEPTGIKNLVPLPPTMKSGLAMCLNASVFEAGEPLSFKLFAAGFDSGSVNVDIRASVRELQVASQMVSLSSTGTDVSLILPGTTNGVIRLTAWTDLSHFGRSGGIGPIAECLVFRHPSRKLRVAVVSDRDVYAPGDAVSLRVCTVDEETGSPVSAVVGLSVTDDTVLEWTERRLQPPRLAEMALLEGHVEQLTDCAAFGFRHNLEQFQQIANSVKPGDAIELLLGTQGWRRFIFCPTRKLLAKVMDTHPNRVSFVMGLPSAAAVRTVFSAAVGDGPAEDLFAPPVPSFFEPVIRSMRVKKRSGRGGLRRADESQGDMRLKPERVRSCSKGGRGFGDPFHLQHSEDGGPSLPLSISSDSSDEDVNGDSEGEEDRAFHEAEKEIAISATDSSVSALAPAMRASQRPHGGKDFACPPPSGGFAPPPPPSLADFATSSAPPPPPVPESLLYQSKRKKRMPAPRRTIPAAYYQPTHGFVRVYAHKRADLAEMAFAYDLRDDPDALATGRKRYDFTETVYWNPSVITDTDGRATVEFELSDSIGGFRCIADAFLRPNGMSYIPNCFGDFDNLIKTSQPLSIVTTLPVELSAGDLVKLPIILQNALDEALDVSDVEVRTGWSLSPESVTDDSNDVPFHVSVPDDVVPPESRTRTLISLRARNFGFHRYGKVCEVSIRAFAEGNESGTPLVDEISRVVRVEPRGFPIGAYGSGLLSTRSEASRVLEFPLMLAADADLESLRTSAFLTLDRSADLDRSLEALLRTPHGCCEQAAAACYPMVLAQRMWLSKHEPLRASFTRSIEDGLAKVLSCQLDDGGFSWWGQAPPNEALSAFAISLCVDSFPIAEVDRTAIAKGIKWLLGRRAGTGRWELTQGHYEFSSPPKASAEAYVTFTLLDAGVSVTSLLKEIAWCRKYQATGGSDNYVFALTALLLERAARTNDDDNSDDVAGMAGLKGSWSADADMLAQKLASSQHADEGYVTGFESIVRSCGHSIILETTSLCIMAWLRIGAERFRPNIDLAVQYLHRHNSRGGMFGSTQSTVLCLKALLAVATKESTDWGSFPDTDPQVSLYVDGNKISQVAIPKRRAQQTQVILESFANALVPGESHVVRVVLEGGPSSGRGPAHLAIPFGCTLNYNASVPDSSPNCPLAIEVGISDSTIVESEVTELLVSVSNRGQSQGMVVAQVSVPGGLEPRDQQLKELVRSNKISAYERRGGREVVLYWDGMETGQTHSISIELTGRVPGSFTGSANSAWVYYAPEWICWTAPIECTVRPREEEA